MLRNCLVIVLDATRAENCSFSGYARETTPFLNAIAQDSIRFESAYSQATSTLPSVWSYLTGRYPYWPEAGAALVLAKDDFTLAEAFQAADFQTAGFSENPYVRDRYGFDQGFDVFEYYPYFKTDGNALQYADGFDVSTSRGVIEGAKDWIASAKDEPWFCYVHMLRPHTPYTAPEPFATRFLPGVNASKADLERLRKKEAAIMDRFFERTMPSEKERQFLLDLYDGNLSYGDSLFQELYEHLEALNVLDDTLIVVLSDHGESFMEHGRLLHSSAPYRELIHVPLLIRAPKGTGLGTRVVSQPVELVDLFPTLADLFGLKTLLHLDGSSLIDLLRGKDTAHKPAVFAQNSSGRRISVQRGPLKLHVQLDSSLKTFVLYELYDLRDDPLEQENLFDSKSVEARELIALAMKYTRSRPVREAVDMTELSEEEREELRGLGYFQ